MTVQTALTASTVGFSPNMPVDRGNSRQSVQRVAVALMDGSQSTGGDA